MAGIPKLAGRAEDIGLSVDDDVLDHRVGLERLVTGFVAQRPRLGLQVQEFERFGNPLLQELHGGHAALDPRRGEDYFLFFLHRVELVVEPGRLETERRRCLARRPDVEQAVRDVLFHLQSELVARRAGRHGAGAAEAVAVVADERLDSREQLGRGHDADPDARTAEDGFDDLSVVVSGDDLAVHNLVSAHDARGRDAELEHRIGRGRELMDEFLGWRTAVENARIPLFEDHHAGALEARVVGIHRGGDEVCEAHVGDEPAALAHLQNRLAAFRPIHDADPAGQHTGLDADEGNRLGQGERAAPGSLTRGWSRQGHVVIPLLLGATLMDGRQRETAGQRARRRPGVYPGQFVRDQRQSEILGPFEIPAFFRIHVGGGDARVVEFGQQGVLGFRPIVREASATGYQAGHRTARHRAHRLHQHGEVEAVGEAPENLPDVVAGERLQRFVRLSQRGSRHIGSFSILSASLQFAVQVRALRQVTHIKGNWTFVS